METHYFGTLNVIRTFAPIIEGNGGGAILNMLSVLSWLHDPTSGAYSAAKAAEWAMTDAIRQELAPRGIHVTAVHVGYIDTDMAAFAPADQKSDPVVFARLALDGLCAGEPEILADDLTRATKALLPAVCSGNSARPALRSRWTLSFVGGAVQFSFAMSTGCPLWTRK